MTSSAVAVTLSNGSTIVSVPASERQICGQSVDLLILDPALGALPRVRTSEAHVGFSTQPLASLVGPSAGVTTHGVASKPE